MILVTAVYLMLQDHRHSPQPPVIRKIVTIPSGRCYLLLLCILCSRVIAILLSLS